MYSYADRFRAVKLYIRLGRRLNATIRQLGYPTKNALRDWYREYYSISTCVFSRLPERQSIPSMRNRRHLSTFTGIVNLTECGTRYAMMGHDRA